MCWERRPILAFPGADRSVDVPHTEEYWGQKLGAAWDCPLPFLPTSKCLSPDSPTPTLASKGQCEHTRSVASFGMEKLAYVLALVYPTHKIMYMLYSIFATVLGWCKGFAVVQGVLRIVPCLHDVCECHSLFRVIHLRLHNFVNGK